MELGWEKGWKGGCDGKGDKGEGRDDCLGSEVMDWLDWLLAGIDGVGWLCWWYRCVEGHLIMATASARSLIRAFLFLSFRNSSLYSLYSRPHAEIFLMTGARSETRS